MKAYLDQEDVQRLEHATENLRDRLLVRLLARTGCRVSEALAVTPAGVDLAQGTVRVRRLKQRVRLRCPACGARLARRPRFCPGCGGAVAEQVPEKERRRHTRDLPLDRGTLALLEEYLDRHGRERGGFPKALFPITRHQAWEVVRRAARRAGLPRVRLDTGRAHHVSPHRLRDAFAVHAVKVESGTPR